MTFDYDDDDPISIRVQNLLFVGSSSTGPIKQRTCGVNLRFINLTYCG